jgi:hypothetical protein
MISRMAQVTLWFIFLPLVTTVIYFSATRNREASALNLFISLALGVAVSYGMIVALNSL